MWLCVAGGNAVFSALKLTVVSVVFSAGGRFTGVQCSCDLPTGNARTLSHWLSFSLLSEYNYCPCASPSTGKHTNAKHTMSLTLFG